MLSLFPDHVYNIISLGRRGWKKKERSLRLGFLSRSHVENANQTHAQFRKIQFLIMIYVQALNFKSVPECFVLKLKYTSEANVLFVSIHIILPNTPINVCVYLRAFISSLAVHLEMKKRRERQYYIVLYIRRTDRVGCYKSSPHRGNKRL